jgi:hypothetical protein
LGRKLPVFVLVCALLCPGPVSAQVARLAVVSARVPAVVVAAPSAGLTAWTGAPVLSAVPALNAAFAPLAAAPLSAAPPAFAPAASAAAPAPAAASAPAAVSAAQTLAAAAAGSAALTGPDRPADGGKSEAGRPFDLSAARPAPDAATPEAGAPGAGPASNVHLSPSRPSARRFLPQVAARLQTLAERALTLPAHFWPFSALARFVAHGEPLIGLTPAAAVRAVEKFPAGNGVVIGRLAWELRDVWSIRGAERSYLSLIEKLHEAKARRPELNVAVSVDAESLGLQLRGVSTEERLKIAGDAILRIARTARDKGLPLELDMGTSDAMSSTAKIAFRVARELRIPVGLALAARYQSSQRILIDWAALARETGLRLGVRLVKGSFIEGNQPDAINLRGPLIARYKEIITLALERSAWIAVAVASQNDEIWEHAQAEARRLGADFTMHVIRGVNLPLQARMRAAGKIERVYVSYGIDAAIMGLTELYTNWKQKRALAKRVDGAVD